MNREEWGRRQVDALVRLGDDAMDAEEWVARLLALVPEDADPATYQLTDDDIAAMARVDAAAVQAARVEWFAADWVPARYKRLLDARVKAAP